MRTFAVLALMLVGTAPAAIGQRTSSPPVESDELESDSDPTRPVLFSIRPEMYSLGDGVEQRVLIFRYDMALLKTRRVFSGAPGVLLRFELPMVGADANRQSGFGIGDAYGQFFIVPYARGNFLWGVGSGFLLPTATDTLTGTGKWVVAPVIAPVWRLPRGLFFVKVQNFASIAGDGARPAINYLLVTPTFFHVAFQQWWVLADSEARTNWRTDGRTGVKSGFQVGRRIAPGVGLWVKPEVWWGPNRDGEWNLKFGLVWYQGPRLAGGS